METLSDHDRYTEYMRDRQDYANEDDAVRSMIRAGLM